MSTEYYFEKTNSFTAQGDGDVVECKRAPKKFFTLQAVKTGNVTAWSADIWGSLDGVTYSKLTASPHTQAIGSGEHVFTGPSAKPVKYFKAKLNSISLDPGASLALTVIGVD